jgi:hypothetical protein
VNEARGYNYGERINTKEHAFLYSETAFMIKKPEWKLNTTVTKKIRVLDKVEEEREINAFDSEMNMPFILDVPEGISMEEIETNRWYRATFKVYTAKLIPEIEEEWSKMAKTTGGIREGIERMKQSGGHGTLYKFELVSLKST